MIKKEENKYHKWLRILSIISIIHNILFTSAIFAVGYVFSMLGGGSEGIFPFFLGVIAIILLEILVLINIQKRNYFVTAGLFAYILLDVLFAPLGILIAIIKFIVTYKLREKLPGFVTIGSIFGIILILILNWNTVSEPLNSAQCGIRNHDWENECKSSCQPNNYTFTIAGDSSGCSCKNGEEEISSSGGMRYESWHAPSNPCKPYSSSG